MANSSKLNVKLIVGSSREGRFSIKAAEWIKSLLEKNPNINSEILDLAKIDLPFFDQPVSPAYNSEPYPYKQVNEFTAKINEADAYIVVTPEYNRGPAAVLKNALDWVYKEWGKKSIGFVSYGSVGGARAVEQLRTNSIELQMAPIREAVHILGNDFFSSVGDDAKIDILFDQYTSSAERMIEQLIWWAEALKAARE